jgi:ABC-type transport system involved in multi-copper enzyme maturation permease subunit
MPEATTSRPGPALLFYRPWHGALLGDDTWQVALFLVAQGALLTLAAMLASFPFISLACCLAFVAGWALAVRFRAWPITRVALEQMLRRRLFWGIYALALMVFLLFFFGQYILTWAMTQLGEAEVRAGALGRISPKWAITLLRDTLKLNGTAETFATFFLFQSTALMIVLALAGSVLIGNDLRYGSLAFYLSRPITRWHYLAGKGLAVAALISLFATAPALVLFLQYGLLEGGGYFLTSAPLLVGILGYGALVSGTLTVMLLALAAWLRQTGHLALAWASVFLVGHAVSRLLVDSLRLSPRLRLIDLWGSLHLVGSRILGVPPSAIRPTPQPDVAEAALVLAGVTFLCLTYLIQRIRAVEVVT